MRIAGRLGKRSALNEPAVQGISETFEEEHEACAPGEQGSQQGGGETARLSHASGLPEEYVRGVKGSMDQAPKLF